MDVMFVNKIPFLTSFSEGLKFGTATFLENNKTSALLKAIKAINNQYRSRGFHLNLLLTDGQFAPLKSEMLGLGITLNPYSLEEHVPQIERHHRTIKERVRGVWNTLPFGGLNVQGHPMKLPGVLVIELVQFCQFWLNYLPPSPGMSKHVSPRELLTGVRLDLRIHAQLEFGEYVQ